jgi:signal transduction histidine kinase
MVGTTLYRYQLNDGGWSAWADDIDAEFINLPHGSYTFKVQARDALGRLTDIVSINFSIDYPIYQRWYMFVLYFLLFALAVFGVMRHRELRLERENIQLENIVQERTMKLREAQSELIRQEKMATVGKLTQGLIDRILNPLNYINNFSKLSEGLVKDLEANVEDEKEVMDKDNYEDTIDVIGMLRGNLQKVSEHGQNTTRTLKAMEEMLKDRTGGIVPMDLTPVLRQDEEMVRKYYASEISQYGIDLQFQIPGESLRINGNADQLSKTIMSLMGNSIYALVKKAQRQQYQPTLALSVDITNSSTQATGKSLTVTIRDNGIGIEETIIDKIFDPFFTTKTTSEAAGVGLYLSREIVQNHGGDISVSSVKNDYSEFCITLPLLTE